MTIIELKDQIIKNNLSNFYVFVGTEIGIINIYLQQMSNKLKLPITRADSVLAIYSRCMGGSMFGDDIGFYVIRDDKDFPKNEKAYETIKKDIGNNVIVLLYEKLDTRLKFAKYFKDDVVEFEKLTPQVLKAYIKKEINLSDKNIDTLINLCGGNYDMCMLEVDKIKHYQQAVNTITEIFPREDDCFKILLENGVIYQPEEYDIFKFTEAVLSKKKKLAFELERILRENGTSSVSMLGTLYNNLKSVMLISCCRTGNVSEITGLDNGQIYFNKKYINNFSIDTLVSAVKLTSNIIDGIKSGYIEDAYATRFVLANLLKEA